jgi:putative hydroxymethylpyrimidine transport system substrate-binding protein
LEAVEAATLFTLNHSDNAWQLFVKAYPKLDDALNKEAWSQSLPRLAASPAAVDRIRYSRYAQFLQAMGLISKVEPIERYIGER